VEYEVTKTIPQSKTIPKNPVNGWIKFLNPPQISNGAQDFYYFSNQCNNPCTINLPNIVQNADNINKYIVSFNVSNYYYYA
jgi:hypothetical protein